MRAYPLILAAMLTGFGSFIVGSGAAAINSAFDSPVVAESGGPRLLTDGQTMDGFGSWSPNGSRVAFMRDGRILLMNSDGTGAKGVEGAEGAWDAAPAWRPDGEQVAFVRHQLSGDQSEVVALDAKSGATSRLLLEPQPIGHLAWSPDGRTLYYSTPHQLKRLEPATGESRTLLTVKAEFEMLAGGLAISRDGKQAIFGVGPRVERGVLYDLWQVTLAAPDHPVRLTEDGGIMPAFSPNGSLVAYRNPRQGSGIYLLNLRDHTSRLLLHDEPRIMFFHPAFSPDGKRLLLSRLVPVVSPGGSEITKFTSALCVHTLEGSGGD